MVNSAQAAVQLRRTSFCGIGLSLALLAPATFPTWAAPAVGPAASQTTTTKARLTYNAYILGPGDSLQIELLDIPELSGVFAIGPDGTMYLPRLRALYVEGLTVEELRYFLTEQFRPYVKNPQIYVRPVGYRPIRIYVGGEVRRPGFYTLSGLQAPSIEVSSAAEAPEVAAGLTGPGQYLIAQKSTSRGVSSESEGTSYSTFFPTVFDAIRTAQGITPYSNLATVKVTRKQALSAGGGRIRTELNILTMITDGDESQNIRLLDGDVVSVGKSSVVLQNQLLKAGQTNLSPEFLQVYVSGRVKTPGGVTLPQGSSLNQAINLAGGPFLLRGKVEFIRFTREGEVDRRLFVYDPSAPSDAPSNPILMAGDVIRVQDSAFSTGIGVVNEITRPLVGVYSFYNLFR